MSASYLAVAGHVVADAARQRIWVRPVVVLQLGERLPPLRRVRLAVFGRRFGVGFFHADETRLFEPAAKRVRTY